MYVGSSTYLLPRVIWRENLKRPPHGVQLAEAFCVQQPHLTSHHKKKNRLSSRPLPSPRSSEAPRALLRQLATVGELQWFLLPLTARPGHEPAANSKQAVSIGFRNKPPNTPQGGTYPVKQQDLYTNDIYEAPTSPRHPNPNIGECVCACVRGMIQMERRRWSYLIFEFCGWSARFICVPARLEREAASCSEPQVLAENLCRPRAGTHHRSNGRHVSFRLRSRCWR